MKVEAWAECSSEKMESLFHTAWAKLHDHNAWIMVSGFDWHSSQVGLSGIYRLMRFVLTGRASLHARHRKFLTLFGTFRLHKPDQILVVDELLATT
jgi:hypothetical protein